VTGEPEGAPEVEVDRHDPAPDPERDPAVEADVEGSDAEGADALGRDEGGRTGGPRRVGWDDLGGLVGAAGAGGERTGFALPLDPDAPDADLDVRMRRNVEAILLVADQPVSVATLAGILERPAANVEDILVDLAAEYAADQRGFVLRAAAGGWRLYTHPASHPAVDAYLRAGTQQRLTQAALETLAVIAYRQPVTRAHVAAVRGVTVDGVLRTLLNRGLIAETGRDDGPGQAVLYGTTPQFMEQLGINSLDELPPVADYLPEGVDLSGLEDTC
jgi:segregation and condensation protein B